LTNDILNQCAVLSGQIAEAKAKIKLIKSYSQEKRDQMSGAITLLELDILTCLEQLVVLENKILT